MRVILYHNPRCSKSRRALELIRTAGYEPIIIDYLKTPLDGGALADLHKKLAVPVRDMMRHGEAIYKTLNLAAEESETALLAAMAAHPILLERPVIVTDKGALIGRPPEKLHDILA